MHPGNGCEYLDIVVLIKCEGWARELTIRLDDIPCGPIRITRRPSDGQILFHMLGLSEWQQQRDQRSERKNGYTHVAIKSKEAEPSGIS